MQVALTKYEDELSQYINRVILLAPCQILGYGNEIDLSEDSMNVVGEYTSIGVYAWYGPNWDQDVDTLCEHYGWWQCRQFTKVDTSMEQAIPTKEEDHLT